MPTLTIPNNPTTLLDILKDRGYAYGYEINSLSSTRKFTETNRNKDNKSVVVVIDSEKNRWEYDEDDKRYYLK